MLMLGADGWVTAQACKRNIDSFKHRQNKTISTGKGADKRRPGIMQRDSGRFGQVGSGLDQLGPVQASSVQSRPVQASLS